ncbi:hypothetical protein E2562_003786 [Oryza meyeriana var. granulata]|uniref:Uncharacterized protein n=1 Tax=Oryza meyeriana var. granulata TaxID=110450 RepID=A0A6G1BS64_9ORYZ|nr:hypothetical protein E2562_003786 [Oryza meyeriana var. granulata]
MEWWEAVRGGTAVGRRGKRTAITWCGCGSLDQARPGLVDALVAVMEAAAADGVWQRRMWPVSSAL